MNRSSKITRRREEEGGRRKDEGERRKKEGERRKEEGGREEEGEGGKESTKEKIPKFPCSGEKNCKFPGGTWRSCAH
jgi:hypothetical protein